MHAPCLHTMRVPLHVKHVCVCICACVGQDVFWAVTGIGETQVT